MSGTLRLRGSTSGYSELKAPDVAGDQTFILPTASGTLVSSDNPSFTGDVTIDNAANATDLLIRTTVNTNNDPQIRLQKARGGTGGPSQITAGDDLGDIQIRGYDGSTYSVAFKIKCTSTTNTGNFAPDTRIVNNGLDQFTFTSDNKIQSHTRLFSNDNLSEGENGFDLPTQGLIKFGRNVTSLITMFQVFGADGKFQLKGNGDAQNTNNSYGGTSDSKLKENIVDANSQWEDIKAIRVRNYNFKSTTPYLTHRQIGVVAQELELVCPGLVMDNIDEDANGNNLGTVTKSVNYSILYMKAVKALQESMLRIETLESKVAALEAGNS